MSLPVEMIKALSPLMIPPGINILLLLLGLLLFGKRVWCFLLMLLAVVSLYFFSTPYGAEAIASRIENKTANPVGAIESMADDPSVGAIVVLGSGRYRAAPEFGKVDVVSGNGLERLRFTARLAKKTALPILTSGGTLAADEVLSEAALMGQSLREDFQVSEPIAFEDKSRTTRENAAFTKELMAKQGINKIYLVTHALHMPRAVYAFKQVGFDVVPAPTAYISLDNNPWTQWIPTARGLNIVAQSFHEYIGLLWYKLLDLF